MSYYGNRPNGSWHQFVTPCNQLVFSRYKRLSSRLYQIPHSIPVVVKNEICGFVALTVLCFGAKNQKCCGSGGPGHPISHTFILPGIRYYWTWSSPEYACTVSRRTFNNQQSLTCKKPQQKILIGCRNHTNKIDMMYTIITLSGADCFYPGILWEFSFTKL